MHNIGESEMKKKSGIASSDTSLLVLPISKYYNSKIFFPRLGPKGTEQRRSQVTQSFISMKVDLRQ